MGAVIVLEDGTTIVPYNSDRTGAQMDRAMDRGDSVGDISQLTTTDKSSIVGAINEVNNKNDELTQDGEILRKEANYTQVSGSNLLNLDRIVLNKVLDNTGVEHNLVGCFYSEFMPVVEGKTYRITIAILSGTYPNLIYYNDEDEVIGYSDGTHTTFTMPEGCTKVRLNNLVANLDNVGFFPSFYRLSLPYQKVLSGKATIRPYLWSSHPIRLYGGKLYCDGLFYMGTSENMKLTKYEEEVTVSGSGAFLYWNSETDEFILSNDDLASDKIYFLLQAKYHTLETYNSTLKFASLSCAFPAFEFDLIENKLHINFHYYGYLFYNGEIITIPQNYTQELTVTNYCYIVYNVATSSFEAVADAAIDIAASDVAKYIPICVKNYNDIIGIINYETTINKKCYRNCYCYGDSLTWYDGQNFTWGAHQGEKCVGYETYLRTYLRLSVSNMGVSGQTTPQICSRLASDSAPRQHGDIILLMGGDNDDRLSVPVGTLLPPKSTFDTTTVYGALQNAIETVLTARPTLRIILMTEPQGWTYRNGSLERVDDIYPNAYRRVAELYGLPLIDNWNNSGINELTRNTLYADPPDTENTMYMYHPYNNGWERISKYIVKELQNYI